MQQRDHLKYSCSSTFNQAQKAYNKKPVQVLYILKQVIIGIWKPHACERIKHTDNLRTHHLRFSLPLNPYIAISRI